MRLDWWYIIFDSQEGGGQWIKLQGTWSFVHVGVEIKVGNSDQTCQMTLEHLLQKKTPKKQEKALNVG